MQHKGVSTDYAINFSAAESLVSKRAETEMPSTEGNGKQKKLHKYKIYRFAICVLAGLLLSSIIVEVVTGSSISAWLVLWCPCIAPAFAALRSIITTDAILKIAETIGFCSIFIAWIYAVLDKTELGLRYGDLLDELYPGYHWFVLGHLITFLVCVWMSKVHRLESALIALLMIIFSCLLQWKTLENIVLFSKRRQRIALDRWNRLLAESEVKGHNDMLLTIFNMADSISLQAEKGRFEMQRCISNALSRFINLPGLKETQCLQGSVDIWERLLKDRERKERIILVQEILKNCPDGSGLGYICIGYILWSYMDYTKHSPDVHNSLNKVCDDLLSLEQGFPDRKETSAFYYMNSTLVLIGIMQFLCGNARLSSNLFGMKPERAISQNDITLLGTAMGMIFERRACERYFPAASNMLIHTRSNRANP